MTQTKEIEVKFRVHDLDALLAALTAAGVRLSPPVRQDDQAYAPVGWRYGDSTIGVPFVRLRTVDGRHLLTLKRPADNALACTEFETAVADRDQMHHMITAMGFYPTVRISKVRRTGRLPDMAVCVDRVDGLGTFLELERIAPADACGAAVQAELAGFVAALGVDAERTEQTYDALLRAAGAPAASRSCTA